MSDFTERAREMLAPYSMPDGVRAALYLQLCSLLAREAAMREAKDGAYLERNQVVAALAKCFPSGVARTAIEGWSEDWHGCVYIDLPTGQVSWHFHDSQAYLFDGLPQYAGAWDGHDTPEKYRRVAALASAPGEAPAPPTDAELETRTGEPHIDGWPLMSGLPRPREAREAPEPVAPQGANSADAYRTAGQSYSRDGTASMIASAPARSSSVMSSSLSPTVRRTTAMMRRA